MQRSYAGTAKSSVRLLGFLMPRRRSNIINMVPHGVIHVTEVPGMDLKKI